MSPHKVLQQYFGFPGFRPGQLEIIESITDSTDTLAILPTGGGKSLCYQVPALMLSGTTIIVSPLISLMQDQVDQLLENNISATYLNSSLKENEYQNRLKRFKNGDYKLIYVAPERLQNDEFISATQKVKIPLVVVDEAHCISEWGNDFRPSYKQIAHFAAKLPNYPVLAAFTATATSAVKQDIIESLNLNKPFVLQKSFRRTNLELKVLHCANKQLQELLLMRLLKKHQQDTGIIYCATRAATEYLAELINYFSANTVAAAYHGGLEKEKRSKIQQQFMDDKKRVIVATNAFGMGVDKANVRFVIHYHPSTSIENYYQEVGRAGRDGKDSYCYLLYNPYSLIIHHELIKKQDYEAQERNEAKLKAMIGYAKNESCRMTYILDYFGEKAKQCSSCDVCNQPEPTHPLVQLVENEEKQKIKQLLTLREKLAKENNCSLTEVMSDMVLCNLALHSPKTTNEFLKIPGIGHGWLEKWQNVTIPPYDYRETSTRIPTN